MPNRICSSRLSRSRLTASARRRTAAFARAMMGTSLRLCPCRMKMCTASRWSTRRSTTLPTSAPRRPPAGPAEVPFEHEFELVDGRPDRRLEQRLFRAVVIEHARLGVAGMVGDLLQRGRREADRRELLEGGLAQLVARAHAQRGLGFGGHGTTVLDRSVSFCTIGQIHGRLTARVHLTVALPSCASTSSAGP